jgi:hypothetical protein
MRVSNVLWFHNSGGVSSQSRILRGRDIMYCFEMDRYFLCIHSIASDQQWFLEIGRETYIG